MKAPEPWPPPPPPRGSQAAVEAELREGKLPPGWERWLKLNAAIDAINDELDERAARRSVVPPTEAPPASGVLRRD